MFTYVDLVQTLRDNNPYASNKYQKLMRPCAQVMRLEAWKSRALGHTELSRAISVEEDLEEDDKLKLILRRESSTSLELPATPRKTS